jgi:uncharacterized DUF497 family protein
MDAEFEWDECKAAENVTKHGVSFETARLVFKDIFAIERPDNRFDYGEQRFNIVGMVQDRLLSVIYAVRGQRIRIISARGAAPK